MLDLNARCGFNGGVEGKARKRRAYKREMIYHWKG